MKVQETGLKKAKSIEKARKEQHFVNERLPCQRINAPFVRALILGIRYAKHSIQSGDLKLFASIK